MFGNETVKDEDSQKEENKNEDDRSSKSTEVLVSTTVPKQEPEFFNASYESLPGFDQMETSPIPFTTPYKVKDPIILLERCDKIWETLKLIKDVQNKPVISENNKNTPSIKTAENNEAENSQMRYITYQPVLNNGNASLPNFKLAVKSMKKLFHCHICGKEYSENRSLRHHSFKVHGIIIPPKRHVKTKDPATNTQNGSERSKRTHSTAQNENSEEKTHGDDLVKNELIKKPKNNGTNVNNDRVHPQTSKSAKKDTKNSVSKKQEIQQEHNKAIGTTIQTNVKNTIKRRRHVKYSADYIVCTLCKRRVKCIKTHLKEYHKVSCPNVMMNELKNVLQNETTPEKKSMIQDLYNAMSQKTSPKKTTPVKQENDISETKPRQNAPTKRKRRYRMSYRKRHKSNNNSSSVTDQKQTCDICEGVYLHASSFSKHMQKHFMRGETKENFDRTNCQYINSPFSRKYNGANKTLDDSTNKQIQKEDLNNTDIDAYNEFMRLFDKDMNQTVTKCDCGRTFRNPHTLYVHKSKCKIPLPNEIDTNGIARNSSDRDSGIGISITIKKKNDSYEVVSKDGDDEKSKDSGNCNSSSDCSNSAMDNCTAIEKDGGAINVEPTQYSKDHSILKLEIINDDVDIDIEGDSQNDVSEKSNASTVVEKPVNNKYFEEVPNDGSLKMRDLCKMILSQKNVMYSQSKPDKSNNKLISCTCGIKFKNAKNLNIHASKTHPLLLVCGYCNEKINGITQYNKHRCSIEEGGELSRPEMSVRCPTCNLKLRTTRMYDHHVRSCHNDPSLPYQCYKCKRRFSNQMHRQVHFNHEHGVVPCSICDKKVHISMKWMHEAYHFGLGFPCHVCKKAYAEKNHILKHYHLVHAKKQNTTVTCMLCWKTFKRKTFVRHIYIHKDSEICRLCKSVFTNVDFLQKHVMSEHRNTYPMVKCDSCGEAFLNKNILNIHATKTGCSKNERKEPMDLEFTEDS